MIDVTRLAVGQMAANCYILAKDDQAIVIDPGDSADYILEIIAGKKLTLKALIATHGHFDHVMAVGEIQLSFPKIPFYIHPKDAFLLDRLPETAKHFLDYDPVVIPIIKHLDFPKNPIRQSLFEFSVNHTPGHTPGSVSLYLKNERILFTGDTLFRGGIGRYDFAYSDKTQLIQSVKTILNYPQDTVIYSGHGEETNVQEEKMRYGDW